VDEDSNNLSLNEATDMAQNRPLWRLMSTFDAMQWCMPVDDDNNESFHVRCLLSGSSWSRVA